MSCVSFFSKPDDEGSPPYHSTETTPLQHLLFQKQLLLQDIPIDDLQLHKEHVHLRKGIDKTNGRLFCVRCGNQEWRLFAHFPCAKCGRPCFYCRKCIQFGRVSECTDLVTWVGPELDGVIPLEPTLSWNGQLSSGQQVASDAVVDTVKQGGELLVWAVCGAGKTEVLFKGIEAALQLGKVVCVATPRTDVVLELTPRLREAFSDVKVISLYGGSEDQGEIAPLVLSTTHQLIRYYKAFDVMIIDEVDAFPYSYDQMLVYVAKQARKDDATVVYLTATPNNDFQQRVARTQLRAVTIPGRFHRHSLPVPKFVWCGNWRKKLGQKRLPRGIVEWVSQHLRDQKQGFLFVPQIEELEKVVVILKKIDERIEGVYSEDPGRREKVMAFRQNEIPILVTTTILERGVTVPNLDVAVFGAEDRIFTESALVQISGRVGRSPKFPSGSVTFFHYGKTNEMVKAKKHIQRMNDEARKKGLIDD